MNPIAAFISMVANYRTGQDLTPLARAFFRQVEGIAVSAVFAGIVAVSPYLNGQAIDWANVLHVFVIAFGTAFGLAVLKYCKAHGDAPQNPAPAQSAPTPVSGGAIDFIDQELGRRIRNQSAGSHYPTDPMLKNVPLPRAQRSAHG